MYKYIVLVFLFLIGCNNQSKQNNSQTNNFQPGYVLTFDDDYVVEWQNITKLFEEYDATATFFVSNFQKLDSNQIQILQELQKEGYEIGFHSSTHKDALLFLDNHTMEEYLNQEILSSLKLMKENKLNPITFAYPYGSNDEETDNELLKYFVMLRDVYEAQKHFYLFNDLDDEDFYFSGYERVISGLCIDSNFKISIEDVKQCFNNCLNENKIIVFYAHRPVITNAGDYEINTNYLKSALKLAKKMKLKSYRFEDLALFIQKK